MIRLPFKLAQKLSRGGIVMCQTLFISIACTYGLHLTGFLATRYALAVLGGIFIFNAVLMYLRVLRDTHADRFLTKLTLAGISAFVGGAGLAISIGVLERDYSLVIQPLPILLMIPFLLVFLEARDQSARAHDHH